MSGENHQPTIFFISHARDRFGNLSDFDPQRSRNATGMNSQSLEPRPEALIQVRVTIEFVSVAITVVNHVGTNDRHTSHGHE